MSAIDRDELLRLECPLVGAQLEIGQGDVVGQGDDHQQRRGGNAGDAAGRPAKGRAPGMSPHRRRRSPVYSSARPNEAPPVKASHKTGAIIPRQLNTMTARIAIEPTMTGDSSSADLGQRLRVLLVRLTSIAGPRRNG